MAEKETISVKLSPNLWKEVQHRCIDENKQYSKFVEEALKKALKKKK
jgi:metal-responsive CopG/Arc/MetJ family transcriptional regulator